MLLGMTVLVVAIFLMTDECGVIVCSSALGYSAV